MNNKEYNSLIEDAKNIGILNIEISGNESFPSVYDAIEEVKQINLNFKYLAKESKRLQSNPKK